MEHLTRGVVTAFAHELIAAIDRGERVGVEAAQAHTRDGDLLEWLKHEVPSLDLSLLDREKRRELMEVFERMENAYTAMKFGVENNGLCLVLAWTVGVLVSREVVDAW